MKTLNSRFKAFHKENPQVFKAFHNHAKQMKKRGFKTYSAWSIICVIRFNNDLQTNGNFKINNDFVALYARLLMESCPEFEGFFKIRKMDKNRKTISKEERERRV